MLRVKQFDIKKVDQSWIDSELEALEKKMQRLSDMCDTTKLKVLTSERFIDKYVPIKCQAQIGETLKAVLNSSALDKLDVYEFAKYGELNSNVLDQTTTQVSDEMKT